MPRNSPDMEFVAVGKSHFTHSVKLAKDGTHTLFNRHNGTPIRFQKGDKEGAEILKTGVVAVIFDKSIWDDMEEVEALSSFDNLFDQTVFGCKRSWLQAIMVEPESEKDASESGSQPSLPAATVIDADTD